MSRKKSLEIKTLGYPLWFTIIFFCLTVLAPIGLVINEGLKAGNKDGGLAFKFSFMSICIAILVWFPINKLIISKIEPKLIAKQVALEHDYSIDNGNPDKIKYLWYKNEIKLAIFHLVGILLYGSLAVILLLGVAKAFMEIQGIIFIITSLYVIAYTMKFVIILTKQEDDGYEEV